MHVVLICPQDEFHDVKNFEVLEGETTLMKRVELGIYR